jgi:hypothetical protein
MIVKRRDTMRIKAIAILGVLALASTVWAQSLGEIAAQEKKRRKGTTQVITERDLARAQGQSYSQPPETPGSEETSETSETTESASAESTKGEKPKTEEEIRAESYSDWQTRIKSTRERVERLEKDVDSLQLQANDVGVNQFSPARAQLLEMLEKKKQELAAAQQQLADLENERRRSGYSR